MMIMLKNGQKFCHVLLEKKSDLWVHYRKILSYLFGNHGNFS